MHMVFCDFFAMDIFYLLVYSCNSFGYIYIYIYIYISGLLHWRWSNQLISIDTTTVNGTRNGSLSRIWCSYVFSCIENIIQYSDMNPSYIKSISYYSVYHCYIATAGVKPARKNACHINPDSKVHGANMGPTWTLSDPRWAPCWPHEPCYQETIVELNLI